MKRRIELETRKLQQSSSQGKSLSTKNSSLNASRFHLDKYSFLYWKSPKNHNLISNQDLSDSFDTCVFPSGDLSSRTSTKQNFRDSSCQTENFAFENLKNENQRLNFEVKELKNDIEELKKAVKEIQACKKIAKMKSNEDMIHFLERENILLRKSLEKKKNKKIEESFEI